MRRLAAVIAFGVVLTHVPAIAADAAHAAEGAAASAASPALAGDVDWSLPPVQLGVATRGHILPVLYVSFAALQAFDGWSTTAGVGQGAREANPVLGGVANHAAAVWAVKAGVTTGSILMAEHLWRSHRRGQAVATMLVANGVMAAIAAHNAAVLRAQQ
jgi:hypothetical protein